MYHLLKHMSRIGKKPIQIPAGVTVEIANGGIKIKGPKGEHFRVLPATIKVSVVDNVISLAVNNPEEKKERSLWGTYAAHIINMIEGVTKGFKKELEINGVGFRVAMQGKDLKLEVGFSHSVIFNIPVGVTATVEKNIIRLESFDKELLGQVAAELRNVKKPEPYKGKGIKYTDETIRRKAGKTATKAAA